MKTYILFLLLLSTAFTPAHIQKAPAFEKMDALFPKSVFLQTLFTKPSKQPAVFLDTLRHIKVLHIRPEYLPLFNIKEDDSDNNIVLDESDSLFAVAKILFPNHLTGYIVYIKGAYYSHQYSVYLVLFNNSTHKPVCTTIRLLHEIAGDGGFYREESWLVTQTGDASPSILTRKGGGPWYGGENSEEMDEAFSMFRWKNVCLEETSLSDAAKVKATYHIPEMENY